MKNWYRILILFLVSSSLLTFTAAAQQKNTDTERALVLKLAAYLKDSSYIKNTIRQIETEKSKPKSPDIKNFISKCNVCFCCKAN